MQRAAIAAGIALVAVGLVLGSTPLIVLGFLVGVIGGRYGDVGR